MKNYFTLAYIRNLEDKEKFLFLLRNKKKNDINKGKYIGIGGHVEEGESPDQGIDREIFEETGLIVKNKIHCGSVFYRDISGYHETMEVYYVDDYKGVLHECDEGELHWLYPQEFMDLPHWKADEIFLDYVFQGKVFSKMSFLYDKDNLLEVVKEWIIQ